MSSNMYSAAKIYKIWRPDSRLVYIGCTCSTLPDRLKHHLKILQTKPDDPAKHVLSKPGYIITLVESFPCDSRDQLLARCQHHIDQTRHVLNPAYPGHPNQATLRRPQPTQRAPCECGCLVSKYYLEKHRTTRKHLALMSILEASQDPVAVM